LKAALNGSCSARNEALTLLNKLFSDAVQQVPAVFASRLIMLQKRKGGLRPIAVGELRLRFCSLCAIELCSNTDPGLSPIQ
jgi:hypothetical protein